MYGAHTAPIQFSQHTMQTCTLHMNLKQKGRVSLTISSQRIQFNGFDVYRIVYGLEYLVLSTISLVFVR